MWMRHYWVFQCSAWVWKPVWDHAEWSRRCLPKCTFSCILKFGNRSSGIVVIANDSWSIIQRLKKLASSLNMIDDALDQRFDNDLYYRFDVNLGLDAIKLYDWKTSKIIASHTRSYLNDQTRCIEGYSKTPRNPYCGNHDTSVLQFLRQGPV